MTAPVSFPRREANWHLDGARAMFGELAAAADPAPAVHTIVLFCFTNRCGSNYLAACLASTGELNMALEALNRDEMAAGGAPRGGFADFVSATLGAAQLDGRVALKVGIPHLEILWEAGLLDLWRDRIRYVFIERADLLGQAISAEIASQSGQWHSAIAATGAEPVFDRDRIAGTMAHIAEMNCRFDLFFGENGIVPTHVLYEALDAAPAELVARVGRAVGLPWAIMNPARIGLRRQSGPRNRAWRARFLGAAG